MTLSLFHLPPILYSFLPALAAGALAVISYLAAGRLVATSPRLPSPASKHLQARQPSPLPL